MHLTPREIEDRLEEAAYTLRNLPEKDRPRGYGSSWPPVVHDAGHAYGYTPERPMRVIPSAAAISRMEECFDWLLMLNPEDARIVWLTALSCQWRSLDTAIPLSETSQLKRRRRRVRRFPVALQPLEAAALGKMGEKQVREMDAMPLLYPSLLSSHSLEDVAEGHSKQYSALSDVPCVS